MSKKIILKRGNHDIRRSYVPELGEPLYVTDTKQLRIGDGVTPGGNLVVGTVLLLKENEPLPTPPTGLRQWALKRLGALPEFGFAYYPHCDTLFMFDKDTDKWSMVLDETRLCVVHGIDELRLRGINKLSLP